MFRCASRCRIPLHHPLLVSTTRVNELISRPELFALREMNDNQELQRISARLLAMITSITPSLELIEPLMNALMSILKDAEVSLLPPTMRSYLVLTPSVVEDEDQLYASIESGILSKSLVAIRELQSQGTRCSSPLSERSQPGSSRDRLRVGVNLVRLVLKLII
jgi:hypothetical protein